jgi:hypothetical protein
MYLNTEAGVLAYAARLNDYVDDFSPAQITTMNDRILQIKRKIFDEVLAELSQKGSVLLLDDRAFADWTSRSIPDNQFLAVVKKREHARLWLEQFFTLSQIEVLKPETTLESKPPKAERSLFYGDEDKARDRASPKYLYNAYTGRYVGKQYVDFDLNNAVSPPTSNEYSHSYAKDAYKAALKEEIALMSGIKLSSCAIL